MPAAATPSPPTPRPLRRAPARLGPRRQTSCCRRSSRRAARTGGAPGRRPVGRHRPLDPLRDAERRGGRHHASERRPDGEVDRQSGRQAHPRTEGKYGTDLRVSPTTWATGSSSSSAITRGVREERRPGLAPEDPARPQRPVVEGGLQYGSADPLPPDRRGRPAFPGAAPTTTDASTPPCRRSFRPSPARVRPGSRPSNDPRIRGAAYQILLLLAVGVVAWIAIGNAAENLRTLPRRLAFGFLGNTAGFDVNQTVIRSRPRPRPTAPPSWSGSPTP